MDMVTKSLVCIGIAAIAALVVGVSLDINGFDTTSGGYEPPYTGFVGAPIQWKELEVTETGVVKRGYIIDTHVNATTGMISFEFLGQGMIGYRPLSERALAVHKPREAFIRLGFSPEF